MAMADTDERAGIEERLLCAANTSTMKVDVSRGNGSADVIWAAGAASQREQLGLALVNLRSEWDRADKPHKRSEAWIAERAAELKAAKAKDHKRRAHIEALVWHAGAMRQRASTLSGRNAVMGLLGDWAAFHSIDQTLLSPALFHWLAPNCGACDGHGKIRMLDAPGLTDQECLHCRGEGKWPRPLGADVVHKHIARCVGRLKKGMAEKLYG